MEDEISCIEQYCLAASEHALETTVVLWMCQFMLLIRRSSLACVSVDALLIACALRLWICFGFQLVFEDYLERAKEKEEKEAKKRRRLADDFTNLLRNTKVLVHTGTSPRASYSLFRVPITSSWRFDGGVSVSVFELLCHIICITTYAMM